MAIINVTDTDFEEKVLQSKMPVLVDFFAAWCGPCKMAEPVLEEIANAYQARLLVVKIDVDQNKETSSKFGVMSIPTAILFKGGKEIGRQAGFSGKQAYEELIKKGGD